MLRFIALLVAMFAPAGAAALSFPPGTTIVDVRIDNFNDGAVLVDDRADGVPAVADFSNPQPFGRAFPRSISVDYAGPAGDGSRVSTESGLLIAHDRGAGIVEINYDLDALLDPRLPDVEPLLVFFPGSPFGESFEADLGVDVILNGMSLGLVRFGPEEPLGSGYLYDLGGLLPAGNELLLRFEGDPGYDIGIGYLSAWYLVQVPEPPAVALLLLGLVALRVRARPGRPSAVG